MLDFADPDICAHLCHQLALRQPAAQSPPSASPYPLPHRSSTLSTPTSMPGWRLWSGRRRRPPLRTPRQ